MAHSNSTKMDYKTVRRKIVRLAGLILFLMSCHRCQSLGDSCESSQTCSNASEPLQKPSTARQWIPDSDHPCTIERITAQVFSERFGESGLPPMYPKPLVIMADTDQNRNHRFQELTSFDKLLDFFPDGFQVTLSSSNSFSEHRRTIPLAKYIQEELIPDTSPEQRSNETWYLFGETFSEEWKSLLLNYEIPSCQACERDLVALSFGIGNKGSGVQWHVHGPGFAETIWGRKHWVLYESKPSFHPDQTSLNWMEYNYTKLKKKERPWECTLTPGDILYFPNMWYHATINLDRYTVFVSTFTQEHLFVDL